MKKLLGLAVAMMLGLTLVGCEDTMDDTTIEEVETKQEEVVEEPEVKEEIIEEEEPVEEIVEDKVITFENNEEFKHFMTASLDGEEYENYFNNTLENYQEIEFDAYVVDIWNSEKYSTRSEMGLAAGDYDGNDVYNYLGVAIVTRDIATYKIAGLRPGTNVRVKALIEDYDLMYRGNLKIQVQEIEAR